MSVKLTKQKANKIALSIARGNFVSTACQLNKISRRCFYLWCKKGREDGHPAIYKYFLEKVEEAKAQAEAEAVDHLITLGQKDIRAIQFFLTRRYRDKWSDVAAAEDDFSEDVVDDSDMIDETFL